MRTALSVALCASLLPGCFLRHELGDEPPLAGDAPRSGPARDSDSDADPDADPAPDLVSPDACPYVDLAGGFNRGVAALHADGTVYGWGWEEPVRAIDGLVDVVQMDAHDKYVCGLHESGEVSCGILFDDLAVPDLAPGRVPGIEDAVAVSVGEFHACAVLHDGRVACWGYNYQGVLGIPADWERYPEPVFVPDLDDAVQVAMSRDFTCAVRADGSLRCWGWDGARQHPPADLPPVLELGLGAEHACAILVAGGVRCWGSDTSSQLGDASLATMDAVELFVGSNHTCARLGSGAVRCWGSDSQGELGSDAPPSESRRRATPEPLPGGRRAIDVTAGHHGTCALSPACQVRCFGWAPSRTLDTDK